MEKSNSSPLLVICLMIKIKKMSKKIKSKMDDIIINLKDKKYSNLWSFHGFDMGDIKNFYDLYKDIITHARFRKMEFPLYWIENS